MPSRFTPTCVGNTRRRPQSPASPAVHPHVRGEYTLPGIVTSLLSAVHPHVRGEYELSINACSSSARFTPTCVGNTVGWGGQSTVITVHPHVRGEYAEIAVHAFCVRRFTPTCVGNTLTPCASHRCRTVHPHVRGEYVRVRGKPRSLGGSPPRAWGIRPSHRPRCR